jgi:hypothetical protein
MKYKNERSAEARMFLEDIFSVFNSHGLSLSHEDRHGAFIIDEYKNENIEWLNAALEIAE